MPKTARVEGVPLGEFGTASPVGVVSGGGGEVLGPHERL